MRKIVLLFTLLLILISNYTFSQWQQIDTPKGIKINELYSSNNELYAASNKGVYKRSSDKWTKLSDQVEYNVSSVINYNNYLYAGTTTSGIYRSSDEGQNWLQVNNNLTSSNIQVLRLYENYITVGTASGIFMSNNDGLQWEDKSNNIANKNINAILEYNDSLLVGTASGIFMSSDTAKSWKDKNNGLGFKNISDIVAVGSKLFTSVTDGGVYLSIDDAKNWTANNTNLTNLNVSCLFYNNDTLFAGTTDSLYYTTDLSNIKWESMPLKQIKEEVLAINKYNNKLIVANSFGAYQKDFTFNDFNDGFPKWEIYRLCKIDSTIFISTEIEVFQNKGLDEEWKRNSNFPNQSFSKLLELNDTINIMYNKAGVYLSYDTIKTWELKFSRSDISSLEILNDTIFVGTNNGVYRSDDSGINWLQVNIGLESLEIRDLKVMDKYIFAICGQSNAIYGKRLFRSNSLGNEWERVDDLIYGYQDLCVFHNILYRTYANNTLYQAIHRSLDYGNTWNEILDYYESDIISSPYDLHSIDTILFSFSNKNIAYSYGGYDAFWYVVLSDVNGQNMDAQIKGVEKLDSMIVIWSDQDIWKQNARNFIRTPILWSPYNPTYQIDTANVVNIEWIDRASNETSYRICKYPSTDSSYIEVGKNKTSIQFNPDTLNIEGNFHESPYYIYAYSFGGVYSDIEEATEVIDLETIINEMDIQDFKMYPNPVNMDLTIDIPVLENKTSYKISLFNSAGIKLFENNVSEGITNVDFSEYSKGFYFIEISDLENKRKVMKLIKQ